MSLLKKTVLLSAAFGVAASMAFSGGDGPTPIERGIKARQAQMTLYAFNIGILGAMAKGDVDYNAEGAGLAASNLAALSAVWMPGAWLPGSDNASVKGTAALPKLWQDMADVGAKGQALAEAAQAMTLVAGTDLAGLRSGIGAVGKSCGACHESYRAKP